MFIDDKVRTLSHDECWELLEGEAIGRLAYRLADELYITPVNHAVDGNTLLFRTAEGSKLLGVVLGGEVAYEVDRVLGSEARSVVVRGTARHLEEDEAHRADSLHLHPWVNTPKYDVVEIRPHTVTGRAFEMSWANVVR